MADFADNDKPNAALWLDFELRLAILCHLVGKHLHEEVIIHDLMAGPEEPLDGRLSTRQLLPAIIAQNRYEAFLSNWMLEHGFPTGFAKATRPQLTKEQNSITVNDIAAALFYLAENQYVRSFDQRFCLTKSGLQYLNEQLDMVQADSTSLQFREEMLIGFEENVEPSYSYQSVYLGRYGSDWTERDLQLAILNVLFDVHRRYLRFKSGPHTGGASVRMVLDVLGLKSPNQIALSIRYLLGEGYIEIEDRLFHITHSGIDFLNKQPRCTTFH